MLHPANLTSRVIALSIVGAAIAHLANAAPPDEACSLLTPAQVGAALGTPVGAGAYVAPTFKKTCTWIATTSGGGTVTLNLQSIDQFQGGRKLASYGTSISATPVSGVGDDAYYFGSDKLVSLTVRKGNAAFRVAVYAHVPVEKQRTVEKTLALQVVPQL